jgi:hypothetical protein
MDAAAGKKGKTLGKTMAGRARAIAARQVDGRESLLTGRVNNMLGKREKGSRVREKVPCVQHAHRPSGPPSIREHCSRQPPCRAQRLLRRENQGGDGQEPIRYGGGGRRPAHPRAEQYEHVPSLTPAP